MRRGIQSEMIRSELAEVVGQAFISTRESDKLVYSTDWSWMPQMKIVNAHHFPVVPRECGLVTRG